MAGSAASGRGRGRAWLQTQATVPGSLHQQEGPGRGARPPRRQFGGLAAGFVLGWLIGFLVEYAIGSKLVTGSASDPFSVAFGLPAALGRHVRPLRPDAGTTREVEVVDAPVREPRYRRLGKAATSERGQLQGSTVEPRTPDDVDAGREPRGPHASRGRGAGGYRLA